MGLRRKACQMALLHSDADCRPAGACWSTIRWSVRRVVENTIQGSGAGGWRAASRNGSARKLTDLRVGENHQLQTASGRLTNTMGLNPTEPYACSLRATRVS